MDQLWRLWRLGRHPPLETESHELAITTHGDLLSEGLDYVTQFVEIVFGVSLRIANEWPGIDAYLRLIEEQARHSADSRFEALWHFLGLAPPVTFKTVWYFFGVVAAVFKDAQKTDLSIDEALTLVLERYEADQTLLSHPVRASGRHAIFYSIAWLTLIVQPSMDPCMSSLLIELPIRRNDIKTTQNIDISKRPLAKLLRGFGHLLPTLELATDLDERSHALLHAPSLSYYSLKNVGKIHIVWTSSLACHLMFQPRNRSLLLFAFPSFCALSLKAPGQSSFESILRDYYALTDSGDDPLIFQYLKEIMLSYRVIFGQDSRSRKLFQSTERKNVILSVKYYDSLLDTLCGKSTGRLIDALGSFMWPSACCNSQGHLVEQDVYNTSTDFPLLGTRLSRVEAFNLHQQPSRIRDLWRDRRNPLQWYTFWAVLIIGGLTILLSLLQLIVTTAQLALQS